MKTIESNTAYALALSVIASFLTALGFIFLKIANINLEKRPN
jgi:hypothetical protein